MFVKSVFLSGQTALHWAATEDHVKWYSWEPTIRKNHLKIIKLLIEKGADIKAKSRKGETPLDMARKNPDKKFVRLCEKIFQRN